MPNAMRRIAMRMLSIVGVGVTIGCATSPGTLPQGFGVPDIANTARAIAQLHQHCAIAPWRAAMTIAGVIGTREVSSRFVAAFTTSEARLEAESPSGTPSWMLIANAREAVILLKDGRAVGSGSVEDMVQAVIGVRMPVAVFSRLLIACEFADALSTMHRLDGGWGRLPMGGGGKLYVRRSRGSERWRPATLFYPGESLQWVWRVDYDDFAGAFPQRIRMRSADGRVDLEFRLLEMYPSAPVRPELFRPRIPPDTIPIMLNALGDGEILSLAP